MRHEKDRNISRTIPMTWGEVQFAFQGSADAIMVANNQGQVLLLNPAFHRITGVPPKKVLGKRMADVKAGGTVNDSAILRVLETGMPSTLRLRTAYRKDVVSSASPVFDKIGCIERVVCNVRDMAQLYTLGSSAKNEQEGDDDLLERNIIARSTKMLQSFHLAERLAKIETNVLITGETGVGKGLVARFIYEKSQRAKSGPFIKVNCAAIPPSLFESELFGYEKGAFTGALTTGKRGFVEMAHNGFLFLDEIGDLTPEVQGKLLSVIEDRQVTRVGGRALQEIDVRIVAATNKDLRRLAESGAFRRDLYFRLAVAPLHIAPLRERPEDIRPLLFYYCRLFSEKYGVKKDIGASLYDFLDTYTWPGNTRELSNLVEYLFITCPNVILEANDLSDDIVDRSGRNVQSLDVQSLLGAGGSKTLRETVEEYELQLVRQAIENTTSYTDAARLLGTSLSTFNRKAYKLKSLKK